MIPMPIYSLNPAPMPSTECNILIVTSLVNARVNVGSSQTSLLRILLLMHIKCGYSLDDLF